MITRFLYLIISPYTNSWFFKIYYIYIFIIFPNKSIPIACYVSWYYIYIYINSGRVRTKIIQLYSIYRQRVCQCNNDFVEQRDYREFIIISLKCATRRSFELLLQCNQFLNYNFVIPLTRQQNNITWPNSNNLNFL